MLNIKHTHDSIQYTCFSAYLLLLFSLSAVPTAPDGSKWERNMPPPPHVSHRFSLHSVSFTGSPERVTVTVQEKATAILETQELKESDNRRQEVKTKAQRKIQQKKKSVRQKPEVKTQN